MATPIPTVTVPAAKEPDPGVKDVQPLSSRVEPKGPKVDSQESEAQNLIESDPASLTKPVRPAENLKDFSGVDRLLVTRKLKVRGVLSLQGKKNKFFVRTPDQKLLFTIEEENSWWVGYFCYGLRPLQLRVMNGGGREVMRISRPYAFTTRVIPCQLQRIQVYAPPGHLIGSVIQQWAPVKPLYTVRDASENNVFEIEGPRFTVSCFQDVQFQIKRPDGTLVAATNKRWEGIVHTLFFAPITDTFGMVFLDKAMTAEEKALLLAAALLLDYMYYDQ